MEGADVERRHVANTRRPFRFRRVVGPAVWEVSVRYFRVPRRFAYYTAFEFVLAFSMLYELVEWGLSLALAGQDADAYNGQQGDMWDAQKDMSCALLGAVLALAVLWITRRSRMQIQGSAE